MTAHTLLVSAKSDWCAFALPWFRDAGGTQRQQHEGGADFRRVVGYSEKVTKETALSCSHLRLHFFLCGQNEGMLQHIRN